MSFGLRTYTIAQFKDIFKKYPEIEAVIIYGSRAKGNYREGSDIDVTLHGEALTEDIKASIWLDLDRLNTPYLIDLSVYHLLDSEDLKAHIQRRGKLFYKKQPV